MVLLPNWDKADEHRQTWVNPPFSPQHNVQRLRGKCRRATTCWCWITLSIGLRNTLALWFICDRQRNENCLSILKKAHRTLFHSRFPLCRRIFLYMLLLMGRAGSRQSSWCHPSLVSILSWKREVCSLFTPLVHSWIKKNEKLSNARQGSLQVPEVGSVIKGCLNTALVTAWLPAHVLTEVYSDKLTPPPGAITWAGAIPTLERKAWHSFSLCFLQSNQVPPM